MTDREILEATKAEIKRLAKVGRNNARAFDESKNGWAIWMQQADVCNRILSFIDSKQEESVNEEFEKALAEEWKGYTERGAATVDALEDNTQELAFAKGFYRGSKWQKAKDESVTQDLGEYINELSKQFPEVSFAKLSRIAVRVAKWQKEQDQSTIELAEDHAMFAGMEKMKEQIMKNAIKCEITWMDGFILDYTQEQQDDLLEKIGAKVGDKVKLVIIKEN